MKNMSPNTITIAQFSIPYGLVGQALSSFSYDCLSQILNSHFSITDLNIEKTENGKPFLKGSNIYFNYSHSREYLVIAIGHAPIGVDIEYVKRSINVPKISRRFFHFSELSFLAESADPHHAFITLWTQKEALIKANGSTISRDIGRTIEKLSSASSGDPLYLHHLSLPGFYIGHLACRLSEPEFIYIHAN